MTAAALDEGRSGACSVKMLCFTTSTLFWNRHPKIRPTKCSGDGPSWAFKTQKGRALLLGSRRTDRAYHKNGSPWMQRTRVWVPPERLGPSQPRPISPSSRKRSSQSSTDEMPREAKEKGARRARKARNDQARPGPTRPPSWAPPARFLQ